MPTKAEEVKEEHSSQK